MQKVMEADSGGETGLVLSCGKQQLCDRPRRCVTCGSPSGAGVVLGGAGLAHRGFHHAPLGWG